MSDPGTELDMAPMTVADHVAVIQMATEMRGMRETLSELKTDVKGLSENYVSRREWETRNATVDARFASILADLAARRIPWTSIAAIAISAFVLLADVLPRLTP